MTSSLEQVPCGDRPPPPALLARVLDLLAGGELVVLPTETVYGVAARADEPRAVGALRNLKDREGDRALTWHVGSNEPLLQFEHLPAVVARLAGRYWPGPLTLVLKGVPPGLEDVAESGWTGLRRPAHRATAAVLAAAEFPVVMSSANRAGEAPALQADEVPRALGRAEGGPRLLVDGGRARLGESSGVLRVGPGHFELLREGLLAIDDLRRAAGLRLGFCCTGNTCRSPMAETLAGVLLAEALGVPRPGAAPAAPPGSSQDSIGRFGFEVRSMGVAASWGAPASGGALEAMAGRGLDLSRHASNPALAEDVQALDRVYCMTRSHLDALLLSLPPGRGGHVELLDPEGLDIADPIGGSDAVYRACADQIEACLRARLSEWV